ncbi:MAG: F0F1 ATP synthase subunit B' [Pseudomonadota bacterium]
MATETPADVAPGACVGPDGGAIGMPQLCFDWFPNQIFWLIITLGAIYLILTRVALPRIASVLAERNGTITNDIAAAEELKLKAADAEKAYQKALADAKAEAQKIAAETRAEISKEVELATERADQEIGKKTEESQARLAEIRASELESIEAVAKDTVGAIVAALGRPADDKALAEAVEARLKGGS